MLVLELVFEWGLKYNGRFRNSLKDLLYEGVRFPTDLGSLCFVDE